MEPKGLRSHVGSPPTPGPWVLTWLMASTVSDPSWAGELVKSVGPFCLQPFPSFSRPFGCEARPGALTGKVSTGGGGSLLLSVVKAKRTFL